MSAPYFVFFAKISLDSESYVFWLLTRQLAHTVSGDYNL